MFTEFGKMLKKLMIDEGISQGQLAKDLGISPSILSNYMTGKNIPEMRIVEKCIKRFKLEKGDLKNIFSKAFSSAAKANHKIILDTRYFKEEWVDLLVQAITILLLSRPTLSFLDDSMSIDLGYTVKKCYIDLDHREIKIDPV
jgi:transcriptional regulator with XRE-family HTH domain